MRCIRCVFGFGGQGFREFGSVLSRHGRGLRRVERRFYCQAGGGGLGHQPRLVDYWLPSRGVRRHLHGYKICRRIQLRQSRLRGRFPLLRSAVMGRNRRYQWRRGVFRCLAGGVRGRRRRILGALLGRVSFRGSLPRLHALAFRLNMFLVICRLCCFLDPSVMLVLRRLFNHLTQQTLKACFIPRGMARQSCRRGTRGGFGLRGRR